MIDPNIKFKRALKGYDPQEVDAVFDEMQREIQDLKQQNRALSDTIAEYNEKIRQLGKGGRELEDERVRQSLRLASVFDKAVAFAEETEREAREKADGIVAAARREAEGISARAKAAVESSRSGLNAVNRDLRAIRMGNERFYDVTKSQLIELEKLIDRALADAPAQPLVPAASEVTRKSAASAQPAAGADAEDSYERYVKSRADPEPGAPEAYRAPARQWPQRARVVGRFGD